MLHCRCHLLKPPFPELQPSLAFIFPASATFKVLQVPWGDFVVVLLCCDSEVSLTPMQAPFGEHLLELLAKVAGTAEGAHSICAGAMPIEIAAHAYHNTVAIFAQAVYTQSQVLSPQSWCQFQCTATSPKRHAS